ncbi:MAG: hypothetical protein ACRD2T_08265, partial [Thermoanaerobaculia bacterium]
MAWALALFLLATAPAGQAAAGERLLLRDDRGESIPGPLEVCFQLSLRADCRSVTGGEVALPVEGFRSVRIEGTEHGPSSVRRDELSPAAAGALTARVPRKAMLRVEGAPEPVPTLSLYPVDDDAFRRAAFRAPLPRGGALRVPSGEWLASLGRPGSAPDLHLLALAPAELARVRYRERRGWSAVVRCRSAVTDRSLRGARVT